MDAEILALLKYALITRENMTSEEASRKALEMFEKSVRKQLKPPADGMMCRCCGRGDMPPSIQS